MTALIRILLDGIYAEVITKKYFEAGFVSHAAWYTVLLSWALLILLSIPAFRAYKNEENRVSREILLMLFLISVIPFTSMVCFGALSYGFAALNTVYWLIVFALILYVRIPNSEKAPLLKAQLGKIADHRILYAAAILSCLLILYISGRYAHFRINFRLDNVYALRADAKQFDLPVVLTYAFSASRNFNPILLAYFIRRRKPAWAAMILIAQVFSFGIDGSKSTLFLTVCTAGIGLIPELGLPRINRWMLRGTAALLIVCMLFYKLIHNVWLVSLFVRRVMYIPVLLSDCYVDFFTNHAPDFYRQSFLRVFGLQSPYPDIPYMIGDVYQHAVTSANNGLIADAVTNLGYPGVVVQPVLLAVVFRLLDRCTRRLDYRIYITAALYVAFTLTNAFLFTTLLTHGLLVVMVLLAVMNGAEEREKRCLRAPEQPESDHAAPG